MLTTRKKFLQQTGFALAGAALPFSKSLGTFFNPPRVNSLDTLHPSTCTLDLRSPLYTASEIQLGNFTYNRTGVTIQDPFFEDDESNAICTDISNPPSLNCNDTNQHNTDETALRYRAYYRKSSYQDPVNGHDYVNHPLPCVVIFHPGGFAECSHYLLPGVLTICEQLAARGYIAITCEYRTGMIKDTDGTRTSVQQQLAPYRAIQDGRGAIRSIIKKNRAGRHGDRFRIDEDQFFVGGLSAGAITALGIAYYRDQSMINQVFPINSGSGSLTIEQALGHINADNYFGETGSDLDNPRYWPVIRGVLNCWGGVTIPKSYDSNEYDFFAGTGDLINPPIIGFAGANDDTVPFQDDPDQSILNSVNASYKSVSSCLASSGSFILKSPGTNNTKYVKQTSALNMYNVLKHSSIYRFAELYVDCDMFHGIKVISRDNFGIVAPSSEDVIYTYIAVRAAIFFQTIMSYSSAPSSFPPFNHRGKSLFRSTGSTTNATNQRTCTDCDKNPLTDDCDNLPNDPSCQ